MKRVTICRWKSHYLFGFGITHNKFFDGSRHLYDISIRVAVFKRCLYIAINYWRS